MNFELQRKIDYYVGVPICFTLTLLYRLSQVFLKKPQKETVPQKILILKLVEQGATVVAYRSIRRAVEIAGRDNVYMLVFSENAEILKFLNLLPEANILKIRSKNLIHFATDFLQIIQTIRHLNIDTTIDFEFFSRATAIIAFFTGARHRIGLDRYKNEGSYRGNLLTHRLQYNPYLHTGILYYILVEAALHNPQNFPAVKRLKSEPNLVPPYFHPPLKDLQNVQNKLNTLAGKIIENPIVLMNPSLDDMFPQRRWAPERFVELGKKILNTFPQATLVITGPPSEKNLADHFIRSFHPHPVISLAGHTSMEELFAIYTISDLLITTDGGPGHFSSLTPIQTIVLFGPETPALFGPCGENVHVFWANLACSPCINAYNQRQSPCMNNLCMKEISCGEVFEKVSELLQGRKKKEIPDQQAMLPTL